MTEAQAIALADVAALSGGTLEGAANGGTVTGVSIDTRTLKPGDLFVPLPGRNADGHAFLAEAFRRGAAAALCALERRGALAGPSPGPLVLVDDVTLGLQRLARGHRARWTGHLVAVTGSSGKTTTKDLIAAALGTMTPTLRTEGNLNNHWGVPLTLLRLRPSHGAAVVEVATNHPGEIAALAGLCAPTTAVITNAGRAHIEHFGSIEAIAREKASLAHALRADGTVHANADDTRLLRALAGAPGRLVTFGWAESADLRPREVQDLGPAGLKIACDGFPMLHLRLVGRHQVANALAALSVARALGVDPGEAVRALEAIAPVGGRMEVRTLGGAQVIMDCYNANPESTRAALETLAGWPGAARRIAVLGSMLELGAQSAALHAEVGGAVRSAELWTIGPFAADYAEGARRAGAPVRVFDDHAALGAALRAVLSPGTVVLLKASRGAALEQVLEGWEG